MLTGFLSAFIAGLVLNWFFVSLGPRINLLKSRSGEGAKISKLGGIAIFFSFLLAVAVASSATGVITLRLAAILAGLTLMFILGFADDLLYLSVTSKLTGQFIIAIFLFAAGVKIQIGIFPIWLNAALTLLWLVAITNAFNLLDILDGLAAGIATVGYLTFWHIANLTGNHAASLLCATLLGANLAFLKFNFFPAKLYMGDSSSLLNGLGLATISVMISYAATGREVALFAPLLILALPLYDLLFVVLMRWWNKKPITQKSNDHFALRLVSKGIAPIKVVTVMYALNSLFCLAAILLLRLSNAWGIFILFLAISSWLLLAYEIGRISGE